VPGAEARASFGYELIGLPREQISSLSMEPHNAVICLDMLHLAGDIQPDLAELIERVGRATRFRCAKM
jgi:hypothetical protein